MSDAAIPEIARHGEVELFVGAGSLARVGELTRREGGRRAFLVTDPGVRAAGHAARAERSLASAGIEVVIFDGARENPTTRHVAEGLAVARSNAVDFIIGLGGGSSMDCAKGINLLLTNGGRVADYWGVNKASAPMLPSILIPTTAGTGSEAQSFALISDELTHAKMACGDRRSPRAGGLRPRVAILDPDVTATAPRETAVNAALDALSHAIETAACRVRTDRSRELSRRAWKFLAANIEHVINGDVSDARSEENEARLSMLLGAHLAGLAIEQSMLGAAHACANPLTARFGVTHGVAVSVMLPHVVRYNAAGEEDPYSDIGGGEAVAGFVEGLLESAGRSQRLRSLGIPEAALRELAESAAKQWTAGFNPRPVTANDLLALYRAAF
ncbi:MAG: iron-containing alcohol dehydrogenase [Planctomycetota bacterium]|nr:MAG: iron-containing alcohol dehydrogenase [Planctomycetota bacterium]